MAVVTSNKIEENKFELQISIDAQAFEEAVKSVYLKMRGKININGFRKGKAPRHMIEKLYGEAVFYEDAVRDLAPDEIEKALDELGFELVAPPEMEVTSVSKEEGVDLKVNVTVKPDVTITGYKGIEVEKNVKDITDDDVESRLEGLREKYSRLVTVEDRAAKMGDTAVIDFEGFTDGVAFPGGKGSGYDLALGSGQFIPGFEEQIEGRNAGEEFTVTVTFPEEYHAAELAGKPAEFLVKLHEIKEKEIPDIDDEFAKDTTEFDTLDELKADIKKRLGEQAESEAEREAEDKLFLALADKIEADIPEVMFENKIDELVRDHEMRLNSQGLSMDSFLTYSGKTADEFRESYREAAVNQVKVRLALDKIAKLENLEATDEQAEAEIQKMADTYGVTVERIKAVVDVKSVKDDLLAEEASKIVKENAVYTS